VKNFFGPFFFESFFFSKKKKKKKKSATLAENIERNTFVVFFLSRFIKMLKQVCFEFYPMIISPH